MRLHWFCVLNHLAPKVCLCLWSSLTPTNIWFWVPVSSLSADGESLCDVDLARLPLMSIVENHYKSFQLLLFCLQVRHIWYYLDLWAMWVSILTIQAVFGMCSLTWLGSQIREVVGWPLPQVLSLHYAVHLEGKTGC